MVSVEDEVVEIGEDVAVSEAEEVEIEVDLRLEAAEDQEVVAEAAVVLGDVAAEVVVAEAPKLLLLSLTVMKECLLLVVKKMPWSP